MRNKYASVTDPNSFVSDPGDQYHITYDPVVMPDGTVELVPSGKDDIQAYIDSFKDQTDISYIIQRIAMGDTSVLNDREPMYGDFTSMPKSYAEALQLVMDREKQFAQLPLDVRNSFDNDFKKWFATSGTDEWMIKMDSVLIKNSSNDNGDEGEET